MARTLTVNDRAAEVDVVEEDGRLRVRLDDRWHTAELEKTNRGGLYSLVIDGRSWEIFARERPGGFELLLGNRVFEITVGGGRQSTPADNGVAGVWTLTSPMSGQVVEVRVGDGDEVQAGQTLVVVESMKMNNELTAAKAGVIGDLQVALGERVERGRVLLRVS